MSKFVYFLKESLISSRRNLGTTIGGIITLFLSLFMVGVSIMFSTMISNVTTSFEEEVNIRLYISDDAKDKQIDALTQYLESMEGDNGNVASVTFMDKDAVLEEFKKQTSSNTDIVDQLDGNPLPRTYVIELKDTQKGQETANAIIANEAFTKIADNPENPGESVKYGQGTVERLFLVVNLIRGACIAAIILLVFISLVFLNNTIRLAITARRKEISIMRLVGASNGFIRGPFIMEGVLQALVGAILAIISISIIRSTAMPHLETMVTFLPLTVDPGVYTMIYVVLIVAGIAVGALGSAWAMRKYLKI